MATTEAGWTNRGFKLLIGWAFNGVALPAHFYVALADPSIPPQPSTHTLSDLSEVPAGNGYTAGGYSLTPNTTDFPSITQDDTNNLASVMLKTVQWTASGGPLPATGFARWAVLTTDEVTVANRQVIAWVGLNTTFSVPSGETLAIPGITPTLAQ